MRENYKKPSVTSIGNINGVLPALAAPALIGAIGGTLLALKQGGKVIDSTHTQTLTARKNFALE